MVNSAKYLMSSLNLAVSALMSPSRMLSSALTPLSLSTNLKMVTSEVVQTQHILLLFSVFRHLLSLLGENLCLLGLLFGAEL